MPARRSQVSISNKNIESKPYSVIPNIEADPTAQVTKAVLSRWGQISLETSIPVDDLASIVRTITGGPEAEILDYIKAAVESGELNGALTNGSLSVDFPST